MARFNEIGGFDAEVDALETSLGGAGAMAATFNTELRNMQATVADLGTDVNVLSRGISGGLRKAFDGLVFDGMKLSDALRSVAQSMVDATYNAAIRPVAGHFGDLIGAAVGGAMNGILPFADGAAFSQGRVTPLATGGIVSGPVTFPMRGGVGLMGEAGPEAIMPLTRGADGRLGVQARGNAAPVNITMNISTPDAASFQRSQSQIAAQMSRALSRGQRHR
ncbi:phage tail tape measure protein [Aliiroseovarius sp.]|uniref:phage tail tape measure protein n=1 Tax=Aliiroseovarius sp. TaxID=1872442 RepID=UPI00262C215C|nr:phage tail tape measure protein [Aliiroseovarius sp.]